jgi:hypothetical protein
MPQEPLSARTTARNSLAQKTLLRQLEFTMHFKHCLLAPHRWKPLSSLQKRQQLKKYHITDYQICPKNQLADYTDLFLPNHKDKQIVANPKGTN